MDMVIGLFVIGATFELLLFAPGLWRLRGLLVWLAVVPTAVAAGMLMAESVSVGAVLVAGLIAYRVFNMARIVAGRMNEQYLRRTVLRTSLALLLMLVLVAGCWWAWASWQTNGNILWLLLTISQALAAAFSLFSALRTMKHTAWPAFMSNYTDAQLPSLTVAIPARNETVDLEECLRTVIASDYPKLEILVYDDCSQTGRTPEIIRSFAHDGVRFLQGTEPMDKWLPKNYAYDQLARQSNGEYILFCGVDMRFQPHTFRQLVATMLDRQKQMLSVVPQRARTAQGSHSLIQAMRYWWEFVPPRRLFNRPPVLSSCWVVRRKLLESVGGFAAVTRSIVPEAHFAHAAVRQDDSYSFLRAGNVQALTSVKSTHQQQSTAIRVRYPQVHRRLEQVLLHSVAEITFLFGPFALALAGFWIEIGLFAHLLAGLASALLIVTNLIIARTTRVQNLWFGAIATPLMVLVDVGLLHYSMFKYEFSTVLWKGRNVCIPAMHVIPRLPKI